MATVAEWFDKYLRALHDTDDPIYKSLISDVDGVPAGIITTPMDFNAGAVASVFEWIRQLSLCLSDQLVLSTASGKYLDLMVHEHIGIVRFESESDTDYIDRVRDYIIANKVSRAAIIHHTRPYSSPGDPEILDGTDDAAFADVSYADVTTGFQASSTGPFDTWWVFPALSSSIGGTAYFFVLKLQNTASGDIAKVVDIVNRWIAAGIRYELQIVAV